MTIDPQNVDIREAAPHTQTRVFDGARTIEVDERAAAILGHLWQLGCRTEFSCQGDDTQPAELVFSDAMSLNVALRWFLSAAHSMKDEPLIDRLCSRACADAVRTPELFPWTIEAWPKLGFESGHPSSNGDPLYYRVSMPSYRDLDLLTSRIPALTERVRCS